MAESLKIIQIGDLHFPEYKNNLIGDVKDEAAPDSVVQAVAPNKLQSIMRKITNIAEGDKTSGLLICGDLTSYGEINEYKESIKYLNKAVEVGNLEKWPKESLHVVPGNHDVDRDLCNSEEDLYKKFDPLINSWKQVGRNEILPIENVRSTKIETADVKLNLFSLNSCIGCGEKRYLPENIRKKLVDIFKEYSDSTTPKDTFKLLGEQLDTPAFADKDIRVLIKGIKDLKDSTVPVVMAHHNILSQATPRIEVYTELLNSGLFRSSLASCSRPVIYCHGHIHENPIEELTHHQYSSSKIIFVSAPLLIEGFNVLEIVYARNHLPLGCIVHKHRIKSSGSIDNTESIEISLSNTEKLEKFSDKKLKSLLNTCDSRFKRFEEIRQLVMEDIDQGIHKTTLKDLIVEAMWLGFVKVLNKDSEFKHWQIRRCEP